MIFDGDCHFCRRWIERWRQQTGNAVEYEPSQKVAPQFPEIPTVEFQNAVILITADGNVYRAAEAVFRSLSCGRQRWPLTLYEKVPGFASISEMAYDFVSRHRELASNLTRLLWGRDVRVPTYVVSRGIFLRAVGLNYLIAFVSLWVQVDGLVGERGILPVRNFLPAMKAGYGTRAILALPTICWINSSNSALHLLCGAGVIASVALMAGLAPVIALTLCFCSYLSLTIAGQTFLRFQ